MCAILRNEDDIISANEDKLVVKIKQLAPTDETGFGSSTEWRFRKHGRIWWFREILRNLRHQEVIDSPIGCNTAEAPFVV